MANPQKENGYTAIANELFERIVKTPLLGSEFQVVLFVIRKTYGFHKKHDQISLTQFEKGTGVSRPTIIKAIKNLVQMNMLVKTPLPAKTVFSVNKDWESWVVKTGLLVKSKGKTSKDAFTKTSKDAFTHKRNKDNKRGVEELLRKYKPDFIK